VLQIARQRVGSGRTAGPVNDVVGADRGQGSDKGRWRSGCIQRLGAVMGEDTTDFAGDGVCDARFRGVREAFAGNFARHGEVGAAVAVTIESKPVVDLWAGHADATRTRRWARDTIVNVASATKGPTAICAHRLADRGLLDLDAPVAAYWPEFAQAGKAALPVHLLLSHRAGLPAIDKPLSTAALYDWDTMVGALAAQAPWWEPGTRHGYHTFTFGWLVGEVVRRITGKSLGGYWREEVAGPLGIDCHIGLDARHDARVAEFLPIPRVRRTSRQSC
jgi:CubicO group peptidase (beta-lactamase class C family)